MTEPFRPIAEPAHTDDVQLREIVLAGGSRARSCRETELTRRRVGAAMRPIDCGASRCVGLYSSGEVDIEKQPVARAAPPWHNLSPQIRRLCLGVVRSTREVQKLANPCWIQSAPRRLSRVVSLARDSGVRRQRCRMGWC